MTCSISLRLMFIALLSIGAATSQAAPPLTVDDRVFLTEAGTANQKEIDLSAFAQSHAHSEAVKSFAETMVRDHTRLGADLAKLSDGTVTVPAANSTPDPDLAGKSGDDFDKAYMGMMVSDHDATVVKFQATVNGGRYSAAIRAAAKDALPTVRHHDAMAKSLMASLNAAR